MKHVIISVSGGVAEVEYASEGIAVEIVDFDNMEDSGGSANGYLEGEVIEALIRKAKEEDGSPLYPMFNLTVGD